MPQHQMLSCRYWPLTLIAAFGLLLSAHAQVQDASTAGEPVTIAAPWRFHTGDDPLWASPNFDDSQWPLLRMDRSWSEQGYSGHTGFAWYRIRLQLPASKEPIALGLDWVASSEEVYADGQRIAEMGQMEPEPELQTHLPESNVVVPLPQSAYGHTIELAIRTWQTPRSGPRFGAGSATLPQLGTAQAIGELHNLTVERSLFTFLPDLIVLLVAAVIGLSSFGLFVLRPRALEYAWAALYLFGEASIRGFNLYRLAHPMSMGVSVLQVETLSGVVTIWWLLLVWGFVGARKDRLFRAGIVLALCTPLATFLVIGGITTIGMVFVLRAFLVLSVGLLIFARLLQEARRGNRDAQLFLIPFLLYSVMDAVTLIRGALYYAGLFSTQNGLELYTGPYFTVTWDRVGFLLSYLAIGAVLVRRFTQSAQQEQRLATEMESAKEVQAQLVPTEFPPLPHLRIEAAYVPASEVGGDFYQVVEQSDGSVLVVMGDVCGKGLKAAMAGVLAIGAVRALASQQSPPGVLLTRLNREISASRNGGFITCLCARVGREGAITFANAGHPSPYRNGEEVQLISSLPLGIAGEVEYVETTVQLDPGDKVTFLSDGVVEARSETGDIFGFDRTREISRQSAQAIAKAARQFGQEDDITVLTLEFAFAGPHLP